MNRSEAGINPALQVGIFFAMYCSKCKASNLPGKELCARCGHRLLVLKPRGQMDESFQGDLQENILERVSALEEALRAARASLDEIRSVVDNQEKIIFLNHNAFLAIMEMLSKQGRIRKEDLYAAWDEALSHSLKQLSLTSKFETSRPRILALHGDERRTAFETALARCAEQAFSGNPGEGRAGLERLYGEDPDNYELAFFLGQLCFDLGEDEEAERFIRITLKASPRHSGALLLYGLLLLAKPHRRDSALDPLRNAFDLTGGAAVASLAYGAASSVCGDHEQALRILGPFAGSGKSPFAGLLVGRLLAHQGDPSSGLDTLARSVAAHPEYLPLRFALVQAYLKRGRHHLVMEELDAGLKLARSRILDWLDPPMDFLIPQAAATTSPAMVAQALEEIERFLEDQTPASLEERVDRVMTELSASPHAHAVLAGEALRGGHGPLASLIAARILSRSKDSMDRAVSLAVLFRCGSDADKVKEAFRVHLDAIQDARARFAAHYLAALLHLKEFSGRAAARGLFHQALEVAPDEDRWRVLLGLGWLDLLEGRSGPAVERLQASSSQRAFPGTTLLLAAALTVQSRYQEAEAALCEAWPLHDGVFPTCELLREEVASFDVRRFRPSPLGLSR